MALPEDLQRFESALLRLSPEFARAFVPPATSDQFARVAEALAPYEVNAELEQLWAWHGGMWSNVFEGYELCSPEVSIREHEFYQQHGEPAVLVPLFIDGFGGRLSIEAGHKGAHDDRVWRKGKGYGPLVGYRSLTSMIRLLTAALEEELVEIVAWRDNPFIGVTAVPFVELKDRIAFTELKDQMDPVDGRELSAFPHPEWPESWLASIGIDRAAHLPTGRITMSIAEAARAQPGTRATVEGAVTRPWGWAGGTHWFRLLDGDGNALLVSGDFSASPYEVVAGHAEVDIEVGSTTAFNPTLWGDSQGTPATALAIRPDPGR